MEWLSIGISLLGFLLTYTGICRKVVTKEDLKGIIDQLNDISDRVVELEKKVTLLEYRLDQLNK